MHADPEKTGDLPLLYQQSVGAMVVSLGLNLSLAVIKVIAGALSHSIAMIADAANSVGDALTSALTIYALRLAQKPADREHPYGHSRIESVAALTVAVLIGASAVAIAVEALRAIPRVHELPPTWVLWVAAGNVAVKEAVFRYKRVMANRTGSQAVLANAWDHRADALCSAAVLVGLLVIRLGGPSLIWADEAAALVVAGFILYSSLKLYRRTASSLMDEQCEAGVIDRVRIAAQATPGVIAIEQVRARRSGLEIMVDIHIEVDADHSVRKGHRIGHAVQNAIVTQNRNVTHVLVHVEPADKAPQSGDATSNR